MTDFWLRGSSWNGEIISPGVKTSARAGDHRVAQGVEVIRFVAPLFASPARRAGGSLRTISPGVRKIWQPAPRARKRTWGSVWPWFNSKPRGWLKAVMPVQWGAAKPGREAVSSRRPPRAAAEKLEEHVFIRIRWLERIEGHSCPRYRARRG